MGVAVTVSFDTLLRRFSQRRVLVVGDMVADEYLIGRPARISREAPVLVLQYADRIVRPGGATNTAQNISALGARACVVGVVGDDDMGRTLRQVLDERQVATSGLIVDHGRPTSTKTRVVGKGHQEAQQQIVRIDRVDTTPIDGRLRDQMIEAIATALSDVDALLISDYENGVISQEVIDACLPRARRQRVCIVVDSHGDLFRFKGVTAATPNQPEAEATLQTVIQNDDDLLRAGAALLAGMEAKGVLITRGSEGMALVEAGKPLYKLPVSMPDQAQVVDPTGAGDTVAAVFTLALAGGATMRGAAYLADLAGGEVVRRPGAATITREELSVALRGARIPPPRDG